MQRCFATPRTRACAYAQEVPRCSKSIVRRMMWVHAATAAVSPITVMRTRQPLGSSSALRQAEQQVLDALSTTRGRGARGLSVEQREVLQVAVEVLEADGGAKAPTTVPSLNGKWRLLYTSRPGTASPIQNSFTGVEAFSVFQEVLLGGEGSKGSGAAGSGARVNNIVDFGPRVGFLKVEAEASTDSRPLPNFVPRRGEGLALFGKSSSAPPARQNMRIDFAFDRAAFQFSFLPFALPYPVPFRLLGDERKGWLDVTYLSRDSTFRLSRGNKGTLFILVKEVPLREQLVAAVQSGNDDQVLQCIRQLQDMPASPEPSPATSPRAAGTWRLIWSQQVIANAQVQPASPTRTAVDITDARIEVGPLTFALPRPSGEGRNPGFVDWLYLDDDLRVTRGNLGSLFIHQRSTKTW